MLALLWRRCKITNKSQVIFRSGGCCGGCSGPNNTLAGAAGCSAQPSYSPRTSRDHPGLRGCCGGSSSALVKQSCSVRDRPSTLQHVPRGTSISSWKVERSSLGSPTSTDGESTGGDHATPQTFIWTGREKHVGVLICRQDCKVGNRRRKQARTATLRTECKIRSTTLCLLAPGRSCFRV